MTPTPSCIHGGRGGGFKFVQCWLSMDCCNCFALLREGGGRNDPPPPTSCIVGGGGVNIIQCYNPFVFHLVYRVIMNFL